MRVPARLLRGAEPITERVTEAVWHEVERRRLIGVTVKTFHTTPIGLVRPARGTADAEIVCRVCAEAVPLRIYSSATTRRFRIQDKLALPLTMIFELLLIMAATAAMGALGSSYDHLTPAGGVVLAAVLGLMVPAFWWGVRVHHRVNGVVVVGPMRTRHELGSGRDAEVSVEYFHTD